MTQGFSLCNVVPRVLRQHLTRFLHVHHCLQPQGQHCIGYLPVQCCPKSIKTTLNRTTLSSQCCLKTSRTILCNVGQWHTDMFSQENNQYYVVLICLSQHCTINLPLKRQPTVHKQLHRKIIYNFVLIYLDQHCIRKLIVENLPIRKRDNSNEENNLYNVVVTMLGQHCIGIFSSQCCSNSPETTMHKKITCTMLALR